MKNMLITAMILLGLLLAVIFAIQDKELPKDTEIWENEPRAVSFSAENIPSDAMILLGKNGHAFEAKGGGEMPWAYQQGELTVVGGSGDVSSKQYFGDIQLHLEWRTPLKQAGKSGQQIGNSGVYLQSLYEVQILDSHENRTYSNGQAASIYKQHIPLVNATKEPQAWQSYDIIFIAPTFDDKGDITSPAFITLLHNGVLVQNHVALEGATTYIDQPEYKAHGALPIVLQDHGDQISYRNIWVREL